jgi:hypothetical protein
MGHQNILTLVDYFETMNNRLLPSRLQPDAKLTPDDQSTLSPTLLSEASSLTASVEKAPTTSPMPLTSFAQLSPPSHIYMTMASSTATSSPKIFSSERQKTMQIS